MKFKMGAAEIKAARKQPGGSNVGKKTFASGKPRTGPYAGPSGGAPKGSYPIPDVSHAKAAIKMSGHAPNPEGIKRAVYNKYPELKSNKMEKGNEKVSADSTKHYEKQMIKFMNKRDESPRNKSGEYDLKANKAMSDMFRQTKKGKEGFDADGHPLKKMQNGSKNTKSFPDLNKDGKITKADVLVGKGVIPAKKNCGSKSMKYQAGSKSMKATPDSTNYFKKKIVEESFKKSGGKFSGFNEKNSKIDRKIGKLGEDIDRQELKGKSGYDSNGHPLKKMQLGTKSTKDSTAYFSNVKNNAYKVADEYRNAVFSGGDVREKAKKVAFKASDDLVRQFKKGKPGYDKDGHPLKKKSSGASGSYAEGTKAINFKKKPMMKRADGSTSQRGLYDNIRANKGSGKKPTPEMLKQEKKIKFGK